MQFYSPSSAKAQTQVSHLIPPPLQDPPTCLGDLEADVVGVHGQGVVQWRHADHVLGVHAGTYTPHVIVDRESRTAPFHLALILYLRAPV